MRKNLLLITSVSNSKKKPIRIYNSFTQRKYRKNFQTQTLQDIQKDLILNLSKNPDVILKDKKFKKTKDFPTYIKQLDDSISKYQLTYFFPKDDTTIEDEKGPNEKFMNKQRKQYQGFNWTKRISKSLSKFRNNKT